MAVTNHKQTNANSRLRHLRKHVCLQAELTLVFLWKLGFNTASYNNPLTQQKSLYFSSILLGEIIPYQFSFMSPKPAQEHNELQYLTASFKS